MTTPARILCIEDNPMNWRLVQRLLGQAGYEMHWASEGLKGYEMAVELAPALILLDINLPGLSGFEVATKLRQNKDLDGTLIVALTAKTMKADRDTALVTGCDGFISKPIDPFRFVDQVNSYLEGRRDRIEASREGETLRQFSQQVVEHLEGQLKELQDSNKKLLEAQSALEQRNLLLSGLMELSQSIVAQHDGPAIQLRVMSKAAEDFGLRRLVFYRTHESGGYLEGQAWEHALQDMPVLATDHPLVQRLLATRPLGALWSDALTNSPYQDEGSSLGLWGGRDAAALLPLWSRDREDQLWGLLGLARSSEIPFQAFEAEILALYGGLLQVSLENAGLIAHLNESSRALGSSFDRLEAAYQELQDAQRALLARERQAAVGDLFHKVATRLQSPLSRIRDQAGSLEKHAAAGGSDDVTLVHGIQESSRQMDGLIQALLRRTAHATEGGGPEWVDLGSLLRQEVAFLQAVDSLPESLSFSIPEGALRLFGVASDFAQTLRHLVDHAMGGQSTANLSIRVAIVDTKLCLAIQDQGGQIAEPALLGAFQPFARLGESSVPEGRQAGAGLPAAAQLMAPYGAELRLENVPGGTMVTVEIPMEGGGREGSLS
ncbi:MAG TPA: response regulator [Holophagaceae bacterium]|nr:response regulator [Holophagaceae bacterium]